MLPYDTLSQKHPEYSAARIQELRDLYAGGYDAQERASTYLPQLVGEHETRWTERYKQSAFVGYLGEIVDFYAANLFAQPLAVEPADGSTPTDAAFYETFSEDCDLASTSVPEQLREIFTTAAVQGRAYLGVDLPAGEPGLDFEDAPPSNLLEEELSGRARAYSFEVPIEQVIDWEIDTVVRRRAKLPTGGAVSFDVGSFKWVVIHRARFDRTTPEDKREKRIDEWKVWRRLDDGRVAWQLYRYTFRSTNAEAPAAESMVDLVAEGVTSFERIPVLELRLPKGLWIGNKVALLNKEHWQRRSILNASENRSLVAIPYVTLGSEVGAMGQAIPSSAQRDPGRGLTIGDQMAAKGWVVLGGGDTLGFAEPDGGAHQIAEERLSKLVDEMHRVSHLMASSVSNTSTAVGRSGASKKEDRSSTVTVLYAYAAIVREFVRILYETVSEARGESVSWVAKGLDRFELDDRAQLVEESIQIDAVQIPSTTFAIAHKQRLASLLLPTMGPQELAIVNDEIEKSVREELKAKEERKAALAANPLPPPPLQPPPAPPQPAPPATKTNGRAQPQPQPQAPT